MPGRAPGPIGMNGASTPRIDSGTAVRNNTPAPGGVGGAGSHNSGGYHYEMHEVGWLDMSDAAHAIWDALRASRALVGPIVIEQTGLMLEHIMAGLLPGLMMAIGVMAGTTAVGAAAGAIIGALAGGIGAAPGAIIGGQLGYDLGTAAMALLGLGFLAHGIVEGLPQLKLHAEWATKRAINSLYVPPAQKRSELNLAARDYALAQALLLKLVLMSLVALLLKKPTAASVKGLVTTGRNTASAVRSGESVAAAEAGVAEIVAQLRASRLGEGFATWVESHWKELIENPKLRPQVKRTAGPVRTSEAVTPSQLRPKQEADPAPRNEPPRTSTPKPKVTYKAGYSEEQILAIPKGQRPPPSDYLDPKYSAAHLDTFKKEGGGFFFTADDIADPAYQAFNPKKFVMAGSDLEGAMAKYQSTGDVSTLEHALGYQPGSLAGKKVYMLKIEEPSVLMPSGNEGGANLLWKPGGLTDPGGMKEAVLDNVSIKHNNDIGALMKDYNVVEVN